MRRKARYTRQQLIDIILPDTCTMELIVTEYDDIPTASYLVPILSQQYPLLPRTIIIDAIYELHQFAGEYDNTIEWSRQPCTL